jgi:hypothetical protein
MATLQKNQTVNTKHEQTSCPCPEKISDLGIFSNLTPDMIAIQKNQALI